MLNVFTKRAIKQSTTAQLTEMYYEIMRAISLHSAHGTATDQGLEEMVAEVVGEMKARKVGDDRAA